MVAPSAPVWITGEKKTNIFPLQKESYHVISWGASPTEGVASYYLYRNGVKIAALSASQFSYEDRKRPANAIDTYSITAVSAEGEESESISTTLY